MKNAPLLSPQSDHAPGITGLSATASTPLLGREQDIEDILRLLDGDHRRVVTLVGPGGVGKTRLAEEVTRAIASAFAHGACFVRLDAIRDPADLSQGVAIRLGLQQHGDMPPQARIDAFLRKRHMLLVLDNLEQVIGAAAPWIVNLLEVAPRIRILVTSRIPLHIASEVQLTVPALDTARGSPAYSPAVLLFAERATAVRHDFVLDQATAITVEEICRQLDGLPLAIELAAARIKILSPQALLARLTDRLTVLSGDRQDVPPRLRSMRDAIAWSYELLAEEEQALFRSLSVFLEGFTLDAAEFVGAWPHRRESAPAAIDTLHALVDQSLIQVVQTTAGLRYRMLETIREYGLEQVTSLNEAAVHDAHAAYVQNLATRAERELIGSHQALWLDLLESDYPNFRSAVVWLESTGRVHDAVVIYANTCTFLDTRGHTTEVVDKLERWLQLPEFAKQTRPRAFLLHVLGYLLFSGGAFRRGAALQEEALTIFLAEGDTWYAAISNTYLGTKYLSANETARGRTILQEAVDRASAAGHHRALGQALFHLAQDAWFNHDDTTYRMMLERAYRVAHDHGDWGILAFILLLQSHEALVRGQIDDAEMIVQESLRIRTEHRSKRDIPMELMLLASIARTRGDLALAESRLSEARRIIEETGHSWYGALLGLQSAILLVDHGDLVRASRFLHDFVRSFLTHQRTDMLALSMSVSAVLAEAAGDHVSAARFLGASSALDPGAASARADPMFSIDTYAYKRAAIQGIGKNAFHQAYEAGSSWSPEEAMAAGLGYRLTVPDVRHPSPALLPPETGLSPRELEVLLEMARGLGNQDIADALFISYRTVTTHVTSIMTKLDAPSRTAAVAWAIRNGIA